MVAESNKFWGDFNICLWFRQNPLADKDSGPPVPNFSVKLYDGNREFLNSGFTDTEGCISLPFLNASNEAKNSLNYRMHDGNSGYISIDASNLYQTIALGDMSVDWLPEDQFKQSLDCSTCTTYFVDNDFHLPSSLLGKSSPLTEHPCSSSNALVNCCGYDWGTSHCGLQQFSPDFKFLHQCDGCEKVIIVEPLPPVDCSTCDMYYPEAGMGTDLDDHGNLRPLTKHACTNEDQNADGRWGSSCCAYHWETKQCGVQEFDKFSNSLYASTSGFLYPCGGVCESKVKKNLVPLVAIIVSIVVVVLLLVLFYYKGHIIKRPKCKGDHDNMETHVKTALQPLYTNNAIVATLVSDVDDHVLHTNTDFHPVPLAPPMAFK